MAFVPDNSLASHQPLEAPVGPRGEGCGGQMGPHRGQALPVWGEGVVGSPAPGPQPHRHPELPHPRGHHGFPAFGCQWSWCNAAPQPGMGITGAHMSFGKSGTTPPHPQQKHGAGESRVSAAATGQSREE